MSAPTSQHCATRSTRPSPRSMLAISMAFSTPCTMRPCRFIHAARHPANKACAIDWQLFFNTTTGARFETRDPQYRIIGDTGIAFGSYALSVNYNNQGRQVVHEGRYTMTYTQVDGVWQIVMQHNTPAGDDPQPVRGLRPGER